MQDESNFTPNIFHENADDDCILSTGRNTTQLADTRKLNKTAITNLLDKFNLGSAPVSVWVNESMSKCFSAYNHHMRNSVMAHPHSLTRNKQHNSFSTFCFKFHML